MTTHLLIDGSAPTPDQVAAVARDGLAVQLDPAASQRVGATRAALESLLGSGELHYGVNTGFGSLASTAIGADQLRDLQRNLIRSHASGVGQPLPTDVVRATMLLLVASLARARSGVRPRVIEAMLGMLNAGVTPIVPEIGSVGASGDLAPLAHIAQVLIGEGEAEFNGNILPGGDAMSKANLQPITLEAKEGLALINGTHLMTARLALTWCDFARMFDAAVVASAMSIDAVRATDSFLDPRIYEARNQPGPRKVARRIRALIDGSEIVRSHLHNDPRVQDPYSIRCAPIVLGAAWDAAGAVRARLGDELGAVTDNPLVFAETDPASIVSAGNFHGMPVAIPLDTLAISIAHIAGVAERRVYHMLSVFDAETHLSPFLSPQPGLHSGFMVVQYAAAAACNELVGLANPASVANISTCAGMEDYNSFGPRSAAKAARGVELARSVVAIELLCAAQAIEVHRPLKTGKALEAAHAIIRSRVEPLTDDRSPAPDIAAIEDLIAAGSFTDIA